MPKEKLPALNTRDNGAGTSFAGRSAMPRQAMRAAQWFEICLTKKFDEQGVIAPNAPREVRAVGEINMMPAREKMVSHGKGKNKRVYRRIRVA